MVQWQMRRFLGLELPTNLYYVTPSAGWVTDWVGYYLTRELRQHWDVPAYLTTTPHWLAGQVLHYGELGAFLASIGSRRNQRNRLLVTLFHGTLDQAQPALAANVELFLANAQGVDRVVTACQIMVDRLIRWGIPAEKVAFLPLGVDLAVFTPPTPEQKQRARHRLGIPADSFCVGSFQKDGVGWGDGLGPKYIKGPDIFLQVMEQVHRKHKNLFVLLTAPARGYVKQGLEKLGVPYRHQILNDFFEINEHYHALDMYLITSREEGGPQAVVEAMATAVPLVSTRVGMAPDVIRHGDNGFLAEVEDVDALTELVLQLIDQPQLRQQLNANGLATAAAYDWSEIAAIYYQQILPQSLKKREPVGYGN
jgi:glycosyltransferase involved in cell wall biosynthesis